MLFNDDLKRNHNQRIFEVGKAINCSFEHVLNLPGSSKFQLEKSIGADFPKAKFDCCERDKKVYKEQRAYKPSQVNYVNQGIEEFMQSVYTRYDLIYLDFCGKPSLKHGSKTDPFEQLVLSRTKSRSVFAITEFFGRQEGKFVSFKDSHKLFPIIAVKYGHMLFRIFVTAQHPDVGFCRLKILKSWKNHKEYFEFNKKDDLNIKAPCPNCNGSVIFKKGHNPNSRCIYCKYKINVSVVSN
jgi:hypothetical protein